MCSAFVGLNQRAHPRAFQNQTETLGLSPGERAIFLDLASAFLRAAAATNATCWLYGGTLMAYRRTGGQSLVMPWDDDMDLAMLEGKHQELVEFVRNNMVGEEN